MSKSAVRYAEIERETNETTVRVVLDLDGGTRQDIATGIGFFDHMLELFAFHGHCDLGVTAESDLSVDDLHAITDVGIVLGRAIKEAAGSGSIVGIASVSVPSDDGLVSVAIEVGGRGNAYVDLPLSRDKLGSMSTQNVAEFFKALATSSGMTIHIRKLAGENDHHVCEAAFKALGRAFGEAVRIIERRTPSIGRRSAR